MVQPSNWISYHLAFSGRPLQYIYTAKLCSLMAEKASSKMYHKYRLDALLDEISFSRSLFSFVDSRLRLVSLSPDVFY